MHTTARVSWWNGRFEEQFTGFAAGSHLWVHGGALLVDWGFLRGDSTGYAASFQLPFHVWHLTAHFCHLSLQSDQDPRVRGWPTHRLRATLTLFTGGHRSSCQSKMVNESWIMPTLDATDTLVLSSSCLIINNCNLHFDDIIDTLALEERGRGARLHPPQWLHVTAVLQVQELDEDDRVDLQEAGWTCTCPTPWAPGTGTRISWPAGGDS